MNESTKIGIVTGALIIVAILLETRRAKAGVTGASALAGKASDFAQKWVGITEVGANKGFSDNVF